MYKETGGVFFMHYSGAVFFDYDGTLADEKNNLYYPTIETKESIEKLINKGFLVCLATGRAKCYIPDTGINFNGYIASNGAYAEADGKPVYTKPINSQSVKKLITELDKQNIYYSFENQEYFFAKDMYAEKFRAMLTNFNISSEKLRSIDKIDYNTICKGIFAFDTDEQFNMLCKMFKGEIVFDRHREFNSCDASAYGTNKGTGVKKLIETLQIPYENTYAFGDGTNDIGMLKNVAHGVAMGISAKEVYEVAEFTTDTVVNEGVTKALKHYNLI